MANQNFLKDWGQIGSVMGRKMVVEWNGDRHSSGASSASYRSNFLVVFVFCLLMQAIIIFIASVKLQHRQEM